jgi:nitroreductase
LTSPALLTQESLQSLLEAGILAPSGDNAQPWSFRWDGEVLSVFLEASRSRSFFDVAQVASLVSIGAVVENIAVRAAALGLVTEAEWLAGSEEPDCRARLRFHAAHEAVDAVLDTAIGERCVNRRPYRRRPIDPSWLSARCDEVRAGGGRLVWCTSRPEIRATAVLARKADWLRFSHRQLHEDFVSELRFTAVDAERTRDGLPIPTLESGPLAGPFLRFVTPWSRMRMLNHLRIHRLLSWQTETLIRSAPAVGLLVMPEWEDQAFLTGGRLMERVWLSATAAGLAFQPVTALTLFLIRLLRHDGEGLDAGQRRHMESLCDPFRAVFELDDSRHALIMLFRVGYAPPPHARTLRRPTETFWRAE